MAQNEKTYLVRCQSCGTSNRVPAAMEGRKGKCGSCHSDLPALFTEPRQMSETSFDDFVRDYPGPILAEFWAPW